MLLACAQVFAACLIGAASVRVPMPNPLALLIFVLVAMGLILLGAVDSERLHGKSQRASAKSQKTDRER